MYMLKTMPFSVATSFDYLLLRTLPFRHVLLDLPVEAVRSNSIGLVWARRPDCPEVE